VTNVINDLEDFTALDPFFRIIEQGLEGLVDPGHFFDLMADDVTFEYVVTVPGYPPRIEGVHELAELYRPYGQALQLERCYDLAVYHDATKNVAVLEYASEGHSVDGNAAYNNRYISVVTIRNRKIVHWRDYLNPVAVFDALGWPDSARKPLE
jgi:ketosteroid isomerase-like protein